MEQAKSTKFGKVLISGDGELILRTTVYFVKDEDTSQVLAFSPGINYVATGIDEGDAKTAFGDGVVLTLIENFERGKDAKGLFKQAPAGITDVFFRKYESKLTSRGFSVRFVQVEIRDDDQQNDQIASVIGARSSANADYGFEEPLQAAM